MPRSVKLIDAYKCKNHKSPPNTTFPTPLPHDSKHYDMPHLQLIDAHIHLYPEEIQSDPKSWAHEHGEFSWARCVCPSRGPRLQDWKTVDETLLDMDSAGVQRCILQGWYWQNQDSCRLQNDFYSQIIHLHPDRFWAFASINPAQAGAQEEIIRISEAGFKGIGELLPQIQGYRLSDPCFQQCMELIRTKQLALCLHVTEPASHAYPGKVDTPFQDFIELGEAWPDCPIILAHLGGLLPLHAHGKRVAKTIGNFYYDLAATPLLYKPQVLSSVIQQIGHQRILYGSDYPLRIFPAIHKNAEMHELMSWLNSAELNQDELRSISYENARRLFA